jgi:hypothetical protein
MSLGREKKITNKQLKEVLMKALKCFLVLFSFVGLLLVGCSDESQLPVSPTDQSINASSALEKKFPPREFTGESIPTGVDDPGIYKYPLPTDEKILLLNHRGPASFTAVYLAGDVGLDLLSGPGEVEINGLTDLRTMIGKWHGKLTLTPSEAGGGEWQFVWHGTATFSYSAWNGTPGWIIPLKEEGHGTGSLTGMQCRMELTIYAPPDLSTWKGKAQGFIYYH